MTVIEGSRVSVWDRRGDRLGRDSGRPGVHTWVQHSWSWTVKWVHPCMEITLQSNESLSYLLGAWHEVRPVGGSRVDKGGTGLQGGSGSQHRVAVWSWRGQKSGRLLERAAPPPRQEVRASCSPPPPTLQGWELLPRPRLHHSKLAPGSVATGSTLRGAESGRLTAAPAGDQPSVSLSCPTACELLPLPPVLENPRDTPPPSM